MNDAFNNSNNVSMVTFYILKFFCAHCLRIFN